MLNPIQNAELFLINIIFDFFLLILTLRFILCLVRADYYNPITQFIVRATQWLIAPLRKGLPTLGNVELASLVSIIVLDMLKFFLIGVITIGIPKNIAGLFIIAFADALKLFLNTFFYAILLQAILSWVQQGFSPIAQLLSQLTTPLMRPIQRLMPPVGGFDLSPIPVLMVLQLLIILVANPVLIIGMTLAFHSIGNAA